MDPIQKDQIIRGLIIIIAGLIGIIFCVLYPFKPQASIYNLTLTLTLIFLISGFILLALGILKKLPLASAWPPLLIGFFGALGTLILILFFIFPIILTYAFIVGIGFLMLVGYQIWVLISQRKQKHIESSG
jgi:hypothetical protein